MANVISYSCSARVCSSDFSPVSYWSSELKNDESFDTSRRIPVKPHKCITETLSIRTNDSGVWLKKNLLPNVAISWGFVKTIEDIYSQVTVQKPLIPLNS